MDVKRLRGLRQLLQDTVEQGSIAIERLQKATARRPFAILESIPGIDGPARTVHAIYDTSVAGVHTAIRLVNRAVGQALDAALKQAD